MGTILATFVRDLQSLAIRGPSHLDDYRHLVRARPTQQIVRES